VSYWKFLAAGAVGPFSGFDWAAVAGTWVQAERGLLCRSGIHACRRADLPYWLAAELWQVELDDPVPAEHKVVARRARLGDRVTAWEPGLQRQFAVACVGRTAYHASRQLVAAGLVDQAEQLAAAAAGLAETNAPPPEAVLPELEALAHRAARAARGSGGGRHAEILVRYLLDALEYLDACPPASVAYVAAHAADRRIPHGEVQPYLAERRWQADWLSARLSLGPDQARRQ
jgi:hypothetical protein